MKKFFCILLIVALCLGLCGCGISFNTYPNAEKYSIGGFTYDAQAIDAVEINWVSGQVRLVELNGQRLNVSEAEEGLTQDQQMRWFLDGRTLRIQFWKSGLTVSTTVNKKLYLEFPQDIDLKVNVTSAEVEMGSLSVKALSVFSTSGDVQANSVTADSVTLNATSGDFRFGPMEVSKSVKVSCTSGDASIENLRTDSAELTATSGKIEIGPLDAKSSVKVNTTSGRIALQAVKAELVDVSSTSGKQEVGLYQCGKANIKSTSGHVILSLLHGSGATVQFSTASGSFNGKSARGGATQIVGDGTCAVTVSTASGNLTVQEIFE